MHPRGRSCVYLCRLAPRFWRRGSSRTFLDETDGVGGYALFATREAQTLGGGCLDADGIGVTAYDLSQTLLHGRDMWVELGAFGADGGIDIAYRVALFGDEVDGAAQEYLAVDAVGLCRCVREVVTDVAQIGGTQ